MPRLLKFIKDNGLSIALLALFATFLIGNAVSGFFAFNQQQASHRAQAVGFLRYLGTGRFLDSVFANWQAAILQLTVLILFGVFLYQRGATHSKKPGRHEAKSRGRKTLPRRFRGYLYRHSLSLAFIAIFLVAFAVHLIVGAADENEKRVLNLQPQLSVGAYAMSAQFWFKTLQTWQAEFFAIAVYLLLSIPLREKGSPESKPLGARDEDTGGTNE